MNLRGQIKIEKNKKGGKKRERTDEAHHLSNSQTLHNMKYNYT